MDRLRLASCMAENTEPFCERFAAYVEERLGLATECVSGIPWEERERLFDAGWIHLLWLCGWPYVDKADLELDRIELLAAPVPAGERYNGMPVYFSDVVVRSDRPYRSFLDLRGGAWAFNEPRSHSGFNVVRAYLAELSEPVGFFVKALESGAHSRSVEMVLDGEADGAAIDSTVLEWLRGRRRGLVQSLRVVQTLGPSPIPPWVVSKAVPPALRNRLRELLLVMHRDAVGAAMLSLSGIERFAQVEDRDYDPIRRMVRKAERVLLA